jgi:hypothetical protein
MSHTRALLWAGAVIACWSGCSPPSGSGDGDADSDTDTDTDADADADGDADGDADADSDADADTDEPTCTDGEFGDTCSVQGDCCPGLVCFAPADDSRPSICTEWCEGECPEGYGCQVFDDGSGGEARVCWYPADTLCRRCEENDECGEVRDLCIGMPGPDDDTFCSIYCESTDPYGCPVGFTCTQIEAEMPTHQCMPDDGVDNDCDGGTDNDPAACGLCQRCVDAACVPVPEGEDPREECPGIDCDAYYWGWEDETHTCYRMGDVPTTLAGCDGAGACRTAAVECPLHAIQGPSAISCEGTIGVCQNVEGCEGTTAGRCVDVDLGEETCGLGECEVTVERCVGGLEQPCVPGTPRAEACNDLDDDCDGDVDVADTFAVHGHEPNESCADYHDLGVTTAPGDASVGIFVVPDSPTLYPGNDNDYYWIVAAEPTDSPIECIPVICEERYRMVVTLTRPPDGAAYQLCASSSACGTQSCTGSDSLELTWSGSCGGNNDRTVYFSVRSPSAAAFDCHAYDLRLAFEAWIVDGAWPGCF